MLLSDAQRDMRTAYYGGVPGVLASALVWLSSGVVALSMTPERAVVALLAGGAVIHPVAIFIAKGLGRSGSHQKGNPMGTLAFEVTIFFLLCLPIAYAVSMFRLSWFFPSMLALIGGRYLTFSTVYGMRVYWGLGALIAVAGFVLYRFGAPVGAGPFTGAAIELAFLIPIFSAAAREDQNSS